MAQLAEFAEWIFEGEVRPEFHACQVSCDMQGLAVLRGPWLWSAARKR